MDMVRLCCRWFADIWYRSGFCTHGKKIKKKYFLLALLFTLAFVLIWAELAVGIFE